MLTKKKTALSETTTVYFTSWASPPSSQPLQKLKVVLMWSFLNYLESFQLFEIQKKKKNGAKKKNAWN